MRTVQIEMMVPDHAKYIAQDHNGCWWWYQEPPIAGEAVWYSTRGDRGAIGKGEPPESFTKELYELVDGGTAKEAIDDLYNKEYAPGECRPWKDPSLVDWDGVFERWIGGNFK